MIEEASLLPNHPSNFSLRTIREAVEMVAELDERITRLESAVNGKDSN